MIKFEMMETHGHEQVIYCSKKEAGLRAIIAIHNTTLGPSLGGCRMWNYATYDEALTDVLRLSRGMTYKAAVAGLNLGGGKAVIIGDSRTQKNELLFRAFGKFVNGLAGRYITAEDVGTDVKDMEYVRMETRYVTGISKAHGGSGDPSPVTAYGIYVGMKACALERWGSDSLKGKKVAVQGAGNVSKHLCEHLYNEGAEIFICDIREERVKSLSNLIKINVVDPDKIYEIDADIFAPTALGGIINDVTIPKFKFEIIAGGANNQLEDEDRHGMMLHQKNILYAPDYVINAGGLINVANELEGYRQDRAMKQAEGIYEITMKIINTSKKDNIPTHKASNKIAEQRIKNIANIKNIYSGGFSFSGRSGELLKS